VHSLFASSLRRANRRALVATFCVISVIVTMVVVSSATRAQSATGSNGTSHTFSQVSCTAHVGNSTVTQKEDITVWAIAPDSVAQGETFSASFPSIPADLPSSSQGLTINSYKNLLTKYRVNDATVVVGSGTNDGPATINGNSTPAQTDTTSTDMSPDIPGPIPPGHLVPPNSAAQITAPSGDATVTISAIEVDTTANVQSFGDVPVTCPVPANTLTSTQVGAGGATTTTAAGVSTSTTTHASTTTTTLPQSSANTLQCGFTGAMTFKPGVHTTSTPAPKATSTKITVKGTMTNCTGGPSGLKAPITHGTFSAVGTIKTPQYATPPTCARLEQSTSSIALKTASKLQNGTKSIASLNAPGAMGPISTDGSTSVDVHGIAKNRGAFQGKPILVHLISNVSGSGFAAACDTTNGVTTLQFIAPSAYYVGPPPAPSTTTTTEAPTTTTTQAPTTTTTEQSTTTTTTTPTNPLPPEVVQAITTACNTLGTTVQPLGVDISPLVIGCTLIANGQGSFLLQTFLISPQLGCTFLAGASANNPAVAAACVTFATAIQPYSSQLAALIPEGFF
jgi:hypothetical protein